MADFQKASDAFLDWFKSQPGATFNPSIQLTDLRDKGEGRGIIATSDIPAETELFTIPRKSIISTETSELAKKLPKILSTLGGGNNDAAKEGEEEDEDSDEAPELIEMPDPWLDLILVMVYEYLQGDASAWKPYFDVLPREFDTLMFWESPELEELQASVVKERVGKASADEMFHTKVLPVVKEHRDVFYPSGAAVLGDDELVRLAHRMGSIIMAYAFDLDPEDDDEEDEEEDGWVQDADAMKRMGMVPMADMLNADAEFNVSGLLFEFAGPCMADTYKAHLNHEEEQLTMTSLCVIKAGEEVLNYYGQLPNCDLLRRYGYTSAKHQRYDVVEIPWELIHTVINDHFGGKQTGSLDDEELEESFVIERESGDPDETGTNTSQAEFVGFSEELQDQVNNFIAPALKINIDNMKKPDKLKLKAAFAEIMAKTIPLRLKQYSTTAEQDEELLQKEETTGRLKMAIDVRLGEKQLLQEAQVFVNGLLEKYKSSDREAGQPKAKKQKTSR